MTRLTLALIAAGLTAITARADVIATNLGPGDSYLGAGGPTVQSGGQTIAIRFTPTATATLDAIRLPLFRFGGAAPAVISLTGANLAGEPGTVLEQFNPAVFALQLYTLASVAHTTLVAGQPYWIVASANPGANYGWNISSPADPHAGGNMLSNTIGSPTGPWTAPPFTNRPAFEVTGTPVAAVPEPATLAGLGLLTVGGWVLRRRT